MVRGGFLLEFRMITFVTFLLVAFIAYTLYKKSK